MEARNASEHPMQAATVPCLKAWLCIGLFQRAAEHSLQKHKKDVIRKGELESKRVERKGKQEEGA